MKHIQLITLTLVSLTLPPAFAIEKTVSVSGECAEYVTSDRGSLTMTVENTDKNVKVANAKTSETYSALKTDLEKLGLKDFEIETTEYSVNEHREWENNKNVSKGFKSRMGLKISSSEISRLGDVMVAANKHAVTEVGALNTFVSDQKMKSLEIGCLKTASQDAKKKAEALASSLNAKLDGILTVSEANISYNPPHYPIMAKSMRGGAEMMADMATPSVSAGKEKYTLKIQATFKLE